MNSLSLAAAAAAVIVNIWIFHERNLWVRNTCCLWLRALSLRIRKWKCGVNYSRNIKLQFHASFKCGIRRNERTNNYIVLKQVFDCSFPLKTTNSDEFETNSVETSKIKAFLIPKPYKLPKFCCFFIFEYQLNVRKDNSD